MFEVYVMITMENDKHASYGIFSSRLQISNAVDWIIWWSSEQSEEGGESRKAIDITPS